MPAESRRRYVCDVLRSANDTAHWERARALFEQCQHVRRARTVRHLPDDLLDAFAAVLSDLVVTYGGREELFVEHALAVFAEVDNHEVFDDELFLVFYLDRKGIKQRMPSLFETVVETSRRLRDARHVEEALANTGTSGILCGSMSYGPYFNIRGHHGREHASDLDLIVVIDGATKLNAVIVGLSDLPGVDQASIDSLRTRAAIFAERYDDGATVLSHKVALWTAPDGLLPDTTLRGDYHVSLHFLTRQTLDYVLVDSSTKLARATAGGMRTVRDYRGTHTRRADLPRTFSGREHPVTPQTVAVDEGWLRPVTAYLFDENDCYCPGFLQTILLPTSDLRWDHLGVRASLTAFARKFYDRYRDECARNPHALLRPSFTHVRRDAFAPHVIRRFDGVG